MIKVKVFYQRKYCQKCIKIKSNFYSFKTFWIMRFNTVSLSEKEIAISNVHL